MGELYEDAAGRVYEKRPVVGGFEYYPIGGVVRDVTKTPPPQIIFEPYHGEGPKKPVLEGTPRTVTGGDESKDSSSPPVPVKLETTKTTTRFKGTIGPRALAQELRESQTGRETQTVQLKKMRSDTRSTSIKQNETAKTGLDFGPAPIVFTAYNEPKGRDIAGLVYDVATRGGVRSISKSDIMATSKALVEGFADAPINLAKAAGSIANSVRVAVSDPIGAGSGFINAARSLILNPYQVTEAFGRSPTYTATTMTVTHLGIKSGIGLTNQAMSSLISKPVKVTRLTEIRLDKVLVKGKQSQAGFMIGGKTVRTEFISKAAAKVLEVPDKVTLVRLGKTFTFRARDFSSMVKDNLFQYLETSRNPIYRNLSASLLERPVSGLAAGFDYATSKFRSFVEFSYSRDIVLPVIKDPSKIMTKGIKSILAPTSKGTPGGFSIIKELGQVKQLPPIPISQGVVLGKNLIRIPDIGFKFAGISAAGAGSVSITIPDKTGFVPESVNYLGSVKMPSTKEFNVNVAIPSFKFSSILTSKFNTKYLQAQPRGLNLLNVNVLGQGSLSVSTPTVTQVSSSSLLKISSQIQNVNIPSVKVPSTVDIPTPRAPPMLFDFKQLERQVKVMSKSFFSVKEYKPSLAALAFNIKSPKMPGVFTRSLGVRPITPKFKGLKL